MSGLHDRASILSTGDEIVIGQLQDTNARYLAEQLTARGVRCVEHAAVGDDRGTLVEAIRRLAERSPLVIMSGGLGPTEGDLTRPALAEVMADQLVIDDDAAAALRALLAKRGRDATERQMRQAQRPSRAACLPNGFGTAAGLRALVPVAAPHGVSEVFCLPGPPGELRPMFEREVLPRLNVPAGMRIITRLLHVIGVAEAEAVTRLGELTKRGRNPLVGITASGGVLTMRIRYEGDAPEPEATAQVDEAERLVRAALGPAVFGRCHDTLASVVIARLKARGRRLAVVESCTGGLLGSLLTAVPGSSAAFTGGWITYSNQAKERDVGVPNATLRDHGAVSGPVASAMALGGLERSEAEHCVAITGIAGPDGGSEAKPVGTVWIAHAWREADRADVDARLFRFTGDRDDVRGRSARAALALVYFALAADAGVSRGGPLLWEILGR